MFFVIEITVLYGKYRFHINDYMIVKKYQIDLLL